MFVLTFKPFNITLLGVVLFMSKSDKHRTEHGEYVGLNKSYQ